MQKAKEVGIVGAIIVCLVANVLILDHNQLSFDTEDVLIETCDRNEEDIPIMF